MVQSTPSDCRLNHVLIFLLQDVAIHGDLIKLASEYGFLVDLLLHTRHESHASLVSSKRIQKSGFAREIRGWPEHEIDLYCCLASRVVSDELCSRSVVSTVVCAYEDGDSAGMSQAMTYEALAYSAGAPAVGMSCRALSAQATYSQILASAPTLGRLRSIDGGAKTAHSTSCCTGLGRACGCLGGFPGSPYCNSHSRSRWRLLCWEPLLLHPSQDAHRQRPPAETMGRLSRD
ncbi:uncharacterized protein B0H18DRAFT_120580 [Fomitopsis serialis]|uniref:uncharacterized protein n=1 Tax=Fomitopsis serialis TaxID=139415 RepID=UPI002007275E|nr:uncharacterized protein B0H18DRAFT_120580 [Neoantrodia serialis]KAH9930981.1 hypothetical protein B0H18DRAFT_120580 [Neoantrodia serialis]